MQITDYERHDDRPVEVLSFEAKDESGERRMYHRICADWLSQPIMLGSNGHVLSPTESHYLEQELRQMQIDLCRPTRTGEKTEVLSR